MKSRPFLPGFLLALMVVLLAAVTGRTEVPAIVPPTKRTEVLEQARSLLATKTAPALAANPFSSDTFNELIGHGAQPAVGEQMAGKPAAAPRPESAPRKTSDLLEAIATSIKPSGYFVLGGEPTLVFGLKKVKAGSVLTVTYEGTEYTLEVTALDRTNFTLRLNREEFTRPIK